MHTNDYCEERIARYLELAEAAQEAAARASHVGLEETYAQLARQWIELARMAERTIDLSREISGPIPIEAQHTSWPPHAKCSPVAFAFVTKKMAVRERGRPRCDEGAGKP